MADLRLFFLGPPRVELAGVPGDLQRRKVLALLIYLAVSGQPHSRDSLATLFWPDLDQKRARAYLRRDLAILNSSLGSKWLEIDREMIELRRDPGLWLDVTHFRHLLAASQSHGHPREITCAECLPLLTEAAALYSNDFLAGFTLTDSAEFDDWQFFETESLRQELAGLLERLVAGLNAQGDYEAAIPQARRWVALDPLHEPAQRHLIRLYDQAGQPAAALRQYEEYVKLLDEELGLPPEEETMTLHEAIKAKRILAPFIKAEEQRNKKAAERKKAEAQRIPDEGVSTDNIPALTEELLTSTKPAPPDRLFVARQQELAQLDAFLELALRAESQVVFVTGEAGQGKSALLQAFAQRAQITHPDLIVASGTCNAYTGIGDPYLPFREILELLSGAVEAQTGVLMLSGEHIERLQSLSSRSVQALVDEGSDLLDTFIPAKTLLRRATLFAPRGAAWLNELQALVNRNLKQPNSSSVQQAALFEQYTRVIQALARQTPILLLLDDLQWADTGSTNLLFHLGRRLAGHRVMIVGAYRPADIAIGRDGEHHPLEFVINEFQRSLGNISLDLAQAKGEAFVNGLLDSEPNQLSASFRAALLQLTEGHPLFTIELLRGMQERGDLVKDEAGRWVEQSQLDWTALPPRVEGAIGARINRLEPAWRNLLQVASVEGESFTAEVVAQVLQVDIPTVIHQFSQVLDRIHLLVRAEGIRQDGALRLSRYRFRHILIQRYLYQSLDDVERAHYHEALGRVLEALYEQRTDQVIIQLAHHANAANLLEKARIYLAQAGDQARRSAALAEAGRYYQAALALWPEAAQAERANLLRRLGECLWMTGQFTAALEAFEVCYALFERLENRIEGGAVQRLIGRIYWEQGERAISLQHYHQGLTILEQEPESNELAQALSAISQMHMLASENEQAIAWGERALALAKRLDAKEVEVHASNNIGAALTASATPEDGLALLRNSLQQALTLNMPHEACRAHVILGDSLIWHCRYAEAKAIFDKLLAYSTHVGAAIFQGAALGHLTKLDWWQGRWASALIHCRHLRLWRDEFQGPTVSKVWASTTLGRIYNDLGQPQPARQELERELSTARTMNELQTTVPHLGQLARSLAALGQEAETAATIQEFLALLERTSSSHIDSIPPILFAYHWLAAQQANPGILETAEACLRHLERIEAQFQTRESAAALAEARGLAARRNNKAAVAIEQFQEAATHWNSLNRPYDQIRALNDLGQTFLHQIKDSRQAQAAFKQALDLIETLSGQLEDPTTKGMFLNSPLIQLLYQGGAAVGIATIPAQVHPSTKSPAAPDRTPHHNLLLQPTSFIGREKDLAEIQRLLLDETAACRLLTLVGPGGIGKTRLALEVAHRFASPEAAVAGAKFPDGVFFVQLASLELVDAGAPPGSQARLLATTIGDTLGMSFQGEAEVTTQLVDYLRARVMLLVLDNFEHLLTAAESVALLLEILQTSTQSRLLVTSRERLNLQEEWLLELTGLPYPLETWSPARDGNTALVLEAYSAIELFVQRARQVKNDYELSETELRRVARLCQLTQGMPLALELAASGLRVLSTAEIVANLEHSLDFLTTSLRNVPERHRSMWAVFEQSWRLLSTQEQAVFKQLSLFRGGFQREAAQAVTGASLATLAGLVDKSLLRLTPSGRYDIHELLRQFAAQKLAAQNEADTAGRQAAEERHSYYYLTLLNQHGAALYGGRSREVMTILQHELDNIRQAWHWAAGHARPAALNQTLEALLVFYELLGLFREGEEVLHATAATLEAAAPPGSREWQSLICRLRIEQARFVSYQGHYSQAKTIIIQVEPLVVALDESLILADLRLVLGLILIFLGDLDEAVNCLHRALATFRQLNRPRRIAAALSQLGEAYSRKQMQDEALLHLQQALQLDIELGDKRAQALTSSRLGNVYAFKDMNNKAMTYYRQALAVFQELDDTRGVAKSLSNIGLTHYSLGQYAAVFEPSNQALELYRKLGNIWGQANTLENLGIVYLALGEHASAQACLEQGLALAQAGGSKLAESYITYRLARLHIDQADDAQGRAYLDQAMAMAGEMGDPTLVAICLGQLGRIHQRQGADEAALACYRQAITDLLTLGVRFEAIHVMIYEAGLLFELGRPEEGQAVASEATRLAEEIDYPPIVAAAERLLRDFGGAAVEC